MKATVVKQSIECAYVVMVCKLLESSEYDVLISAGGKMEWKRCENDACLASLQGQFPQCDC